MYATLTKMGLNYGPAFQGVISIFLGENQFSRALAFTIGYSFRQWEEQP